MNLTCKDSHYPCTFTRLSFRSGCLPFNTQVLLGRTLIHLVCLEKPVSRCYWMDGSTLATHLTLIHSSRAQCTPSGLLEWEFHLSPEKHCLVLSTPLVGVSAEWRESAASHVLSGSFRVALRGKPFIPTHPGIYSVKHVLLSALPRGTYLCYT